MPSETVQDGESLRHIYDLTSPEVKLDLTKDRSLLKEPEVSEYTGFDILRRGVLRPERGRKPVGISIPVADQPIVSAVGLSDLASVLRNRRYSVDNNSLGINANGADTGAYTASTGIITSVAAGYDFTKGDVCAIYSPVSHRGVYPVLSRDTGASTLTIKTGIAGSDDTVIFDVFLNTPWGRRLVLNAAAADWLVKSPALYDLEGPWEQAQADGFVFMNSDERVASETSAAKMTLASFYQKNDALDSGGNLAPSNFHKVQILDEPDGNLRGILMTNGRKFWLLQGGVLKLMMDLNDDDLLGQTWRHTRIARNRIMLVNKKYPPRVLHLDAKELTEGEVSGEETLAGCITPIKPREIENPNPDLNTVASWLGKGFNNVIGGLTPSRNYKVKIRGVNLDDALESEFVQVLAAQNDSIPTDQSATKENILLASGDESITVFMSTESDTGGFSPPLDPRITHIEVWRSTAALLVGDDAPDVYFLESRMEIATLIANETQGTQNHVLFETSPRAESQPVQIADTIITNFTPLTSEDLLAGGLPPICQDVVSLEGVTFCFGKADTTVVEPVINATDYLTVDSDHTIASSKTRINGASEFTNYVFVAGDKFRILHGGRDANGNTVPLGDFLIEGKIDANNIDLTTQISTVTTVGDSLKGQIIRPFTIKWTKILSDEEMWYSRTDKFNPESFPVRVKTLSRTGDIFRRAVKVSKFIIAIMDRGVHLIRINPLAVGGVTIDTIADSGEGTPWPDSVVVVGTAVLWASQQGLRVLLASPEADIEGRRARISPIGDERFRFWFESAFNAGEIIDAGVDEINGCVRFRRAIITDTGTHYQVLQYNYRNDSFVLLDDDSGFIYASTVDLTGANDSQHLYSVTDTGNVFEVNHEEKAHPYDNLVLQDTLGADYLISGISIQHTTSAVFSPSMAGDIIRFRVGGDEYIRTITTATDKKLTFTAVPVPLSGVVFVIAAVRTKIRWSALKGKLQTSVKTVEKVHIKARKGSRHLSSENLNLKTFSDFRDVEQKTGTVDIFNVDDSGKTTENEVSSIEGQGSSLEVQIETRDARTDYQLQKVEVTLREESDVLVDAVK